MANQLISQLKDEWKIFTCLQKFILIIFISLSIAITIIVSIDSITNALATHFSTSPEKVRLSCIFVLLIMLTLWGLIIKLLDLTKTHNLLDILWFILFGLLLAYISIFFSVFPDIVNNPKAVNNKITIFLEYISAWLGGIIVTIGVAAVSLNANATIEKNRLDAIEAASNNLVHTKSFIRIISLHRLYNMAKNRRDIYLRQTIYTILCAYKCSTEKEKDEEEDKILSEILTDLKSMGVTDSSKKKQGE